MQVATDKAPATGDQTTPSPYRDKVRAMKRQRGELAASQPEVMKAFAALSDAASSPGALDEKTKELIALAIAVVERCDECITIHVEEALKTGATKQELTEALGVAVLMGGGPAVMYATHALAALAELSTLTRPRDPTSG
jgi:AhpD family alkylhydroperoxidase